MSRRQRLFERRGGRFRKRGVEATAEGAAAREPLRRQSRVQSRRYHRWTARHPLQPARYGRGLRGLQVATLARCGGGQASAACPAQDSIAGLAPDRGTGAPTRPESARGGNCKRVSAAVDGPRVRSSERAAGRPWTCLGRALGDLLSRQPTDEHQPRGASPGKPPTPGQDLPFPLTATTEQDGSSTYTEYWHPNYGRRQSVMRDTAGFYNGTLVGQGYAPQVSLPIYRPATGLRSARPTMTHQ